MASRKADMMMCMYMMDSMMMSMMPRIKSVQPKYPPQGLKK